MNVLAYFAVLAFCVAAAVAARFVLARRLLDRWAAWNQVALLQKELRFVRCGPFTFTAGSRVVWRVVAVDREGKERAGFVATGGFFLGPFSDDVAVRWDDEG